MSDYLPITLNSLRTDTIIGCDIYLLVHDGSKGHHVLYCKGDAAFESDKKQMLLRKNINRLFIGKQDQKKYYDYLESNLPYILSNERISPPERAQIVYGTATTLIHDVLEGPRFKNIQRSKKFAYNMVDYILRDNKATYNLLKITSHDYYTYTHSVNVATIGSLFAKNLGLNERDLKAFCTGMLLHDLGKTRLNPAIINKKGRLTADEFEKMKNHPVLGASILRETANGFKEEYMIVLQHHENCDGSGYPYGLKKGEIHSSARIVRIIDIYDALTTNRSYKSAQQPFDALKVIRGEMADVVDQMMFKRFIRFLGGHGW